VKESRMKRKGMPNDHQQIRGRAVRRDARPTATSSRGGSGDPAGVDAAHLPQPSGDCEDPSHEAKASLIYRVIGCVGMTASIMDLARQDIGRNYQGDSDLSALDAAEEAAAAALSAYVDELEKLAQGDGSPGQGVPRE